ncbi:MAG: hypothetical protein WCE68_07735 [Anaerolineales bacterium]
MSTPKPSLSDPIYIALARKLVLLFLLMVVTAMGLVALLLQRRLSTFVLASLLTDAVMGLIAGFSARWIIPAKAPLLRIGSILLFIIGGLALLGWFTGWGFGIDLLRAGRARVDWWEIGQILIATGCAFLALLPWRHPARTAPQINTVQELSPTRRKPQKRPNPAHKKQPASPAANQTEQPALQMVSIQPVRPKRKRTNRSRPKLVLSREEEHRCPYCLELVEPDDPRGVVECEICHTLHHADCWAITGACQVPHFTA